MLCFMQILVAIFKHLPISWYFIQQTFSLEQGNIRYLT